MTDANTFNNLRKWLEQVRPNIEGGAPVALVATKCDAGEEQEEVSRDQIAHFIQEESQGLVMRSFRTSSKSGEGISEVFQWMAEQAAMKNANHLEKDGNRLPREPNTPKKKDCCL